MDPLTERRDTVLDSRNGDLLQDCRVEREERK
jgi:hypothetical protein